MIKGIIVGYWMTYTAVFYETLIFSYLKSSVSGYPTTKGHNSLNVRFGRGVKILMRLPDGSISAAHLTGMALT